VKIEVSDRWPKREVIAKKFGSSRRHYKDSDSFHRQLAETLLEVAPDGVGFGRMLEIGSHTGTTTSMLKDNWPEVDLISLDLQKEGPEFGVHVQGDGEALPFGEGVFSSVFSGSTFQWFEELGASIGGVMKCLQPGGRLGFTQFLRPSLEPFASRVEEVAGSGRFLPLMEGDELESIVRRWGRVIHFSVVEEVKYFEDFKTLHLYLRNMGVGAPSVGQRALTRTQLRELKMLLCRNTEKKGIPLHFCGALVWLEKSDLVNVKV